MLTNAICVLAIPATADSLLMISSAMVGEVNLRVGDFAAIDFSDDRAGCVARVIQPA